MALTTIKLAAMSANSVDSDQYVDGSIDNAHLADDAVGADELAANAVVNASVASSAAIAHSKLANVTDGQILVGNGSNVPTAVAVSGDVTIANTGAVTIAAGAVETGMLADDAVTSAKLDTNIAVTGTVSDSKGNVRNIPASTNTTLVAADAGKHISITAGITIDASTDFAIGDAVTIFNNQAAGNDETITATGIDLYLATDPSVSGATNRTLAPRGVATILCVAADKYVITGAGLS